jgi:hypothetical protein
MRGWWRWTIGSGMMASAVCSTALTAQAPASSEIDVCELATNAEFQEAQGVHPQLGVIPDVPVLTDMSWGPHCDYAPGSIDLFTKEAELERVLKLMEAVKKRDPVQGLGQRAFFTVIYPGDQYRQRGVLAIFLGSRILTLSMDDKQDLPVEATRPKLEGLAKLALPRLK